MVHFLVAEGHGPAWDPAKPRREQPGFDRHAAFADALVEQRVVLLGGPLGEDVDAGDALLLVSAEDEDDVRRILADDPWLDTVLSITSIRPWALWLRASGF